MNEYRSPEDAGYEAWVDAELARIQAEQNATEIGKLAHVIAGLVIARGEHARAIRKNQAATDRFEIDLAQMRHAVVEARRDISQVLALVKGLSLTEALADYNEVSEQVDVVNGRLAVIEKALPEIERRLKLRRRDGAWAPPLGPPLDGAS